MQGSDIAETLTQNLILKSRSCSYYCFSFLPFLKYLYQDTIHIPCHYPFEVYNTVIFNMFTSCITITTILILEHFLSHLKEIPYLLAFILQFSLCPLSLSNSYPTLSQFSHPGHLI